MTDIERQAIQAAHGELGAAIVQMIDSDDQIICNHVRKVHRMLSELLDPSRSIGETVIRRIKAIVSEAETTHLAKGEANR